MGADEIHLHLYYTGDAAPGSTVTVKVMGDPVADPVILWAGSGVLDPPLPTAFGDWYLALPIVTTVLLADIDAQGVSELPAAIPIRYPAWKVPLQVFVKDHLTNCCILQVE